MDQSNSMNFDSGIGAGVKRADVLRFSAPTAVVVLEDENAMAVCSFDQDAHPGIGMTPALGAGKFVINGAIAGYSPNPDGWTSIGEGVALAHGIRYSLNVHAYSNLRMRALLAPTSNEPGATIIVRTLLTEYGVPVAARAACRAELVRPDGTGASLTMPEIEAGVFETAVPAPLVGIYSFRLAAEGRTLRGRLFSREQTLTSAVWKGGNNPPPTLTNDPNGRDDRFCRLIECLLQQKGIQESLRKAGINLDELRRCLVEYCRKPSPRHPPHGARLKLEERLRSIVRDGWSRR